MYSDLIQLITTCIALETKTVELIDNEVSRYNDETNDIENNYTLEEFALFRKQCSDNIQVLQEILEKVKAITYIPI